MSGMLSAASVDWANKIRCNVVDGLRQSFHDGIFTDIEIEVSDCVFRCHKVFLCAISDYFLAMFTSGMRESVDSRVTIKDLSGSTFRAVLDFYYTCDRSVVNTDTAEDLLRAAGLLQMTTLQDNCESYYAENLNVDNALAVWDLAQCLHCEALADKAKRFILANFLDIYTEPDFLHIDAEHLNELLGDDDLRVPDEDYVCEAAVSWLRHDIGSRAKFFNDICVNLRLRYLSEDSSNRLLTFIRNECHLKDSILEGLTENRRYSFPEASSAVAMETPLSSRNYENMLVVIGVHKATGILPTVHAYSFNTKMWFKLSSLPFDPGVGYATCVLDNQLYMSGISLRKAYVLRYDPCANLWEECCQMPEKRRYHEMVVACNHVHAVCGWNKRDGVFTSIIQYHVTDDSWTSLGNLRVGVYSASACAVENIIYVFGGRADDSTRKRDIQSFNINTGQATIINQFPSAVTESRAIAINSSMYLALTNGSIMKVMESGTLSRHSVLPNFDRFNFGLLQRGSSILVVGGDTRYPSGSSQFVDILEVNGHDGKVKILQDRLFNNASAAACRILLIRRVILPRLSVPGIPQEQKFYH
ncbi:kelch-like protein 24 [Biomphalaria glabrata]|uniref:Kelch-like protein 24 n=1 Tax=Biomphalaria glabrata TaxID=6526 RepID=A0A2C9LMX0_BIOGL|nr:kelch-like protein 24 [Biomphalaria glabrata]XP_055885478.1 kelch-like protein 24 [Biomphalaria glabrata]KAI8749637.1 kelch-like protein 24 [Biomphalaria glabrata]